MSTRVVIDLPDEVYHRAKRLAQLMSRDVTDILSDTVALSLPSFSPQSETVTKVSRSYCCGIRQYSQIESARCHT
jgi:hypothetical protein